MCTGCGACAYLAPEAIRMVDSLEHGRRPQVDSEMGSAAELRDALTACPGAGLRHDPEALRGAIPELAEAWGPVLAVFEGHAADPELRRAASSGGAASALALYGIERGGLHGVLHIAARPDAPLLNRSVLSRSREELLAATGSRYAPASPCDGLARIEQAPAPCIFLGKPCDVAAVREARRLRPGLDAKLAVSVAMFCAGTPSLRGTLAVMSRLGAAPERTVALRYRGQGWPGLFRVRERGDAGEREVSTSYADSWQELQAYRQWRCYVCADHSGELADIAVGDPWYREIGEGEAGSSLILARTPRGRDYLHAAAEAGYLVLEARGSDIVDASQPELRRVRGAIWGRIHASRWLGAAAPRYRGFPMFPFWWRELSWKQKAQSFYGTVKRVFTKKLRSRVEVKAWDPEGGAP